MIRVSGNLAAMAVGLVLLLPGMMAWAADEPRPPEQLYRGEMAAYPGPWR
ncbi:MAG: hypothetical protein ACLQNE_36535 [Thermoguttaceae bacterium]